MISIRIDELNNTAKLVSLNAIDSWNNVICLMFDVASFCRLVHSSLLHLDT
jgi:hypothetical protein